MKKRSIFTTFLLFVTSIILVSLTSCTFSNNVSEKNDPYFVDNDLFYDVDYKTGRLTTVGVGTGNTSSSYQVTISAKCSVSLISYSADYTLYNSSKKALMSDFYSKEQKIDANKEFSFSFGISNNVFSSLDSVYVSFYGSSKDNPYGLSKKYKVTFVYNNGKSDSSISVNAGETVSTPSDPSKANYLFVGWYTDSSFVEKYDFSKPVQRNLTLYAKYQIDAATLTNRINTDAIKGFVTIENKCYNTVLGVESESQTSQGSGFCFHVQNGYYYVLTNCHVAYKNTSYKNQKYTIEDYQGNTYTGYLYTRDSVTGSAIDASYDLACLYFKPSSTNVKALTMASRNANPSLYEDVIAIGSPKGQSNSVTYGSIIQYRTATISSTPKAKSDVKFEVIQHTAYTNKGSSGGPLLNASLSVVGVNYAGSEDGSYGLAIPIQKVWDFLESYAFS